MTLWWWEWLLAMVTMAKAEAVAMMTEMEVAMFARWLQHFRGVTASNTVPLSG